MKSSDRLLLGMLAGMGLLVVAGVIALLAVGGRSPEEFPEDTPEGVVQRYLRALDQGQGEEAFGYLAQSVRDDSVRKSYVRHAAPYIERARRIVLDFSEIQGEQAHVVVSVSSVSASGPGSNPEYTSRIDFRLKREEDTWSIISPVYPPFLG